jgi:hypothetical protein
MTMVIEGVVLELQRLKSGVSLLFASGSRPDADAVARALSSLGDSALGTTISFRPDAVEGWLELLTTGLTFELHGLRPALPMAVTDPRYRFGFEGAVAPAGLESTTLITGPHIFGGRAMVPIVRAITGLAASLALALPVSAVCWEPAAIWMAPSYFTRLVVAWLAGGPFPALGLTALDTNEEGVVTSRGLDYFCGQEVEINPREGDARSDSVKLAMRMIDNLIRKGRIERRTELESPSGRTIIAEPTADLRRVRVWRGG